ncbi:MAG: hypothetical protein M1834_008219 [Cirrosporium novae-zelandiae]|nr:MAG: hypothetical protein M1834_008219 [Cirrosporium novae-zelandiae]
MPPTLYLVRHAEGEHNVKDSNHIRDSVLTDFGKKQCHQLRVSFPYHDDISIVLASPLRRAIQTAGYAFGPALRRSNVSFLLVPQAQEISNQPCDIGYDREILETDIPRIILEEDVGFNPSKTDASLLKAGWNSKRGIYEPRLAAIEKRAAALRTWLLKRPETNIVLVTHGAFLHYLTEDWTRYDPLRSTAWYNCEFRQFQFTEDSNEQEAHLFEIGGPGVKQGRPSDAHSDVLTGTRAVENLS